MKFDTPPEILAVIPARFASTRFPGKVIAPLAGKPLVLHTYERAQQSMLVSQVVIATDDDRVVSALEPYGVNIELTRPDHPSGTDRVAEVAALSSAGIIVNVQGDEPLVDPRMIDKAIGPVLGNPDISMATARRRIADPDEIKNPNVVKVVCDKEGRALYFSRSPIPRIRDAADRAEMATCYWQHVGLYVYERDFLLAMARLPVTELERLEKLEQLRVLEHGWPIAVIDTDYVNIGVDSPEDLERVRGLMPKEGEGAD